MVIVEENNITYNSHSILAYFLSLATFYTPENIRKLAICFQGVWEKTSGINKVTITVTVKTCKIKK